jgi:spore germination cell wall hydrolase CwlJ-like protein
MQPVRRRGAGDLLPYLFGGTMLVAAFAFAGHQIGRNAVAHTAEVQAASLAMTATTESVAEKSSLLSDGQSFALLGLATLQSETAAADGKADMLLLDPGEAPAQAESAGNALPKPVLKPAKKVASLAQDKLRILPAAFNAGETVSGAGKVTKRMAVAAKPGDIDQSSKLQKAEKQKVIAQRRVRLAEENCLARAVYFEARSESEIGQMAVAKVILNRVKSPEYPNTICGVVYQGSQRRNSCQFSFACDGLPDDIRQPAAWAQSKRVAQRALAGDAKVTAMLGGATNYHADYVKPKWARSMRKAVKIGRHIFYTSG